MIYRVEIENFHSIKDRQVLDLTVAANVDDPDGRFKAIYKGAEQRVPKVIAIYGANASGKTTILRALDFVARFVRESASPRGHKIPVYTFNDVASTGAPTRIAIELGGVIDAMFAMEGNIVQYGTLRYEIEVQAREGRIDHVISESLFQRAHGKIKWSRVFERKGQDEILFSSDFKITGFRHLLNTLRPDASVIASFEYFNHSGALFYQKKLGAWVYANLDNVPEFVTGDLATLKLLQGHPTLFEKLNDDLSRIDVGITSLRIDDVPHLGLQALFQHSGQDRELPWHMQSQGTRAFVRLFPVLHMALETGGTALVDEFDTLIHPLVLPEILRWFYDDAGRNLGGAQVWMSCHSATLLEYLEKEEVIIAEKDSQGRTRAFSLTDLASEDGKTAVRRSANLYKKYLSGALGGVPVIG
jgi:uncharacterized protein